MSVLSELLRARKEIRAELARPKWQRDGKMLREYLAEVDRDIKNIVAGDVPRQLTLF